jgi:uncharacterized membrane protein
MTHFYSSYFLTLIKISPLFIRLLIDRYWKILTRADSLSSDEAQVKVIGHVLRAKNIKVTDQRLLNLVNILPNHISIDAKERVPALLDQWNITTCVKNLSETNEPIDFSKEEVVKKLCADDINDIQTPCLIRLNNGRAAALIEIVEGLGEYKKSLFLYHPDQGVQIISPHDLINIWSGDLFDMDSVNAFKEPQFFDKNTGEQWGHWQRPGTILLTLLFILAMIHYQVTHYLGFALFIYLGITACLIAGLALSLILAQHAMGNTTGTFAKYCSGDSIISDDSGSENSSQYSCSDVLDSPNAKFLGVSHADFGVAYFSGVLLLFFTSLLTVDAYPYIHSINTSVIYLSFLALIYSGYSIYLQKYRLKKWCRLCLYTQGIVVLQAIFVFIFLGFSHHTIQNHFSLSLTLVLLCTPAFIWHFLRAQLIGKTIQQEQQHQIQSIITSEKTIQEILQSQQQRLNSDQDGCITHEDEDEDLESDLIIRSYKHLRDDNSQALRVVLGLSPSCLHCGSMLEEVYQFLQHNDSAIECRIRLIVSEGDTREARNDRIIAEHITAFVTNESEGASMAIGALRNWYQDVKAENVKQWLGSVRNISDDESIDVSVLLADTSFWVSQKDITVIPAMYIENIHVPFVSEDYSSILLRKLCLA